MSKPVVKPCNLLARHYDEVCWSQPEIRRSLKEVGFDRIRACDSTPFFKEHALVKPGCRTLYLARKSAFPQK